MSISLIISSILVSMSVPAIIIFHDTQLAIYFVLVAIWGLMEKNK